MEKKQVPTKAAPIADPDRHDLLRSLRELGVPWDPLVEGRLPEDEPATGVIDLEPYETDTPLDVVEVSAESLRALPCPSQPPSSPPAEAERATPAPPATGVIDLEP